VGLGDRTAALDRLCNRFSFVTTRRVAGLLAALLCLYGIVYYGSVLDRVYPIRLWLFWHVAILWGYQAVLTVACLGTGLFVVVRLLKLVYLPGLEQAVLGMAVGVVAFTLGMYAGGALGWYHPIFAIALPTAMAAIGWRELYRALREARAALAEPRPRQPWVWLATAFGTLGVGVVYLQLLTPDALNYDATWYHVAAAQDYARAGRFVPFVAHYAPNVPQLHTLLHTWGYVVPGLNEPPLRWMMALHNEFNLFLWTLVGISAAVRWLTEDQRLRGAWAALFLFPYIFVYDHNMGGAADHVLAFFAVPLLLAARRFWCSFSPTSASLLGILAAGALLTKYQAVYLLGPLVPLLGARWLLLVIARLRKRPLPLARDAADVHRFVVWAPLLVAGLAIAVSAPHFVKNYVFHRNPVYPFMQDVFTGSRPQVPNAALLIEYVFKDLLYVPHGSLLDKLKHAGRLFLSFSFEPHYSFTKHFPGFGSLFTLLLPACFLVRTRMRLLFAALMGSGGILMWALTFNVDRNLQVILPLLVSVTAALIVQLWRLGWLARLGLAPLVGLAVVWGGDAPFYSGDSRIASSIALIRSGYDGRAAGRFDGYRRVYRDIGKALPADARVLLHTSHLNLGIDREILLDWSGFQGLISYAHLRTPRELHDYFRSLGITHLLYTPGERVASSRQEEVLWYAFVTRHAEFVGKFGGYRLLAMPRVPPPAEPPYRVAVFGMPGYADGVYPIEALSTIEYLWPTKRRYRSPARAVGEDRAELSSTLAGVNAVLVGDRSRFQRLIAGELRNAQALKYPGQFSVYLMNR
jgi:hypothetical protein